jgi:prepilin-type N-terminal cleavage/methylation domain-containing protein
MNKKNIQGFTLIELAIVLVVIAILIGSFAGTLVTRIENNRVTETEEELEEIKLALLGYAYRNGHLPCPDCITTGPFCNPFGFRDGVEDRGTGPALPGECNTLNNTGSVPWVTLGLPQGDAWSTRYRYWVDAAYANDETSAGGVFLLTSPNGAGIIQEPDYITDVTGKKYLWRKKY